MTFICFQGHEAFIYVNECQSHRHCRSPYRFIFQIPCHFINTSIAEGMSCDGITAFNWQRLTENKIIIRPICSATSNLSTCYKKENQLQQQIINWRLTNFSLSFSRSFYDSHHKWKVPDQSCSWLISRHIRECFASPSWTRETEMERKGNEFPRRYFATKFMMSFHIWFLPGEIKNTCERFTTGIIIFI